MYRLLCYDITASGEPGWVQTFWLWCKNHAVYRLILKSSVFVHIGSTLLEATSTRSPATITAEYLNFIVAIILLSNALMSLYWRARLDSKVSRRTVLQAIVAIVYLIDAAVVAKTHYLTGNSYLKTYIPYSAVLRPLNLVLLTKAAQRTLRDILKAIYRSRRVLLLGGALFIASLVIITSLVSNNVTAEEEQLATTEGEGFGAFTAAVLTMFNLQFNGENFGPGVNCGRALCESAPLCLGFTRDGVAQWLLKAHVMAFPHPTPPPPTPRPSTLLLDSGVRVCVDTIEPRRRGGDLLQRYPVAAGAVDRQSPGRCAVRLPLSQMAEFSRGLFPHTPVLPTTTF